MAGPVLGQFYIGGGAGVNSSDITLRTHFPGFSNIMDVRLDNTFNQPQVSILGGYEYDYKNFVMAGELNAQSALGSGDPSITNNFVNIVTNLRTTVEKYHSYGFDLRPGFKVNPRVQLFALLGYQWGDFDIDQKANKTSGDSTVGKDSTLEGFDFGLGVQIAMSDHLALRSQIKHVNYDASGLEVNDKSLFLNTDDIDLSSNQAELDVVYLF